MNYRPTFYIAGHQGLVGSALVRALLASGTPPDHILTRTHNELDLTDQGAVRRFFAVEKPDQVCLAAARVGGIWANEAFPAEFIRENLSIALNVIDAAFQSGVKKLLFLGSSCIYPKYAPQPMPEEALLSGALEPTNEPYAIAKIAGLKLCESYNRQYGLSHGIDYRCLMPANLYGPGDSYHPENSHVVPALIQRFHHAKQDSVSEVVVWGTGVPRREFLYVDDLARACLSVMAVDKAAYDRQVHSQYQYLNVGSGVDLSIREIAELIADVVGFTGRIRFDKTKPDGMPRKMLDSRRIRELGWEPRIPFRAGLALAYQDYLRRYQGSPLSKGR